MGQTAAALSRARQPDCPPWAAFVLGVLGARRSRRPNDLDCATFEDDGPPPREVSTAGGDKEGVKE